MSSVTSQSRTQFVYETLREEVLSCHYAPGERLRIADLCKRLGVSPGGVREALSRLTSEGLLETEPQKGFKIMEVSAADLKHLNAAQCEIEGLCLRRAIELADITWESTLVACHYRLAATPQTLASQPDVYSPDFVSAYTAFRDALVASCDNPWLAKMRDLLNVQALRYQLLSVPSEENIASLYRPMMEAALEKDIEKACELLTQLMVDRARPSIELLKQKTESENVEGKQ